MIILNTVPGFNFIGRLRRLSILSHTESLCPECLQVIPAEIYEAEGKVWITKTCPAHGETDELYWGDLEMYLQAKRYAHDGKGVSNPRITKTTIKCPADCGLCNVHMSHTALANIVLTNRCDLSCWYCFFYATKAGYVYEPTLRQIRDMARTLRAERPVPGNAVQLTGGEPCLRDDLIEIIQAVKEEGIEHVQLNTNGLRLANDPTLASRVRAAGINTVYLSYDGVTPRTNPKNHWEIPAILDHCRRAGVGIVLVPTVIKGYNTQELGAMIRFAAENTDIIRGFNLQPVSLVGRLVKSEREKLRVTIPDVVRLIEEQTNGQIARTDFYTVPCTAAVTHFVEALTGRPQYELSTHFACGMATYVFQDGVELIPITRFVDIPGLFEYIQEKAEEVVRGKSRYLVGLSVLRRLGSFIDGQKQPKGSNLKRIVFDALIRHDYEALGDFHHKALFIGMMHFQDLYNYDIERVKRCTIHYLNPDGSIIPFCAFNVIPEWYRDKLQKAYGVSIPEWEQRTGRRIADDFYKRKIGQRVPEEKLILAAP